MYLNVNCVSCTETMNAVLAEGFKFLSASSIVLLILAGMDLVLFCATMASYPIPLAFVFLMVMPTISIVSRTISTLLFAISLSRVMLGPRNGLISSISAMKVVDMMLSMLCVL